MISRQQIAMSAMDAFRERGVHFTMQDVAANMHISKKTIYKIYDTKEELLMDMVKFGFDAIHERKQAILDSDLPIREKIRKVIIAMPEEYTTIDFRQLPEIAERFPKAADMLREALESNWEPTLKLLGQGIREGSIRPVDLTVLQMMITAGIEAFLSTSTLRREQISYQQALEDMMDILMDGLSV